jgi:hypothetical protein
VVIKVQSDAAETRSDRLSVSFTGGAGQTYRFLIRPAFEVNAESKINCGRYAAVFRLYRLF